MFSTGRIAEIAHQLSVSFPRSHRCWCVSIIGGCSSIGWESAGEFEVGAPRAASYEGRLARTCAGEGSPPDARMAARMR